MISDQYLQNIIDGVFLRVSHEKAVEMAQELIAYRAEGWARVKAQYEHADMVAKSILARDVDPDCAPEITALANGDYTPAPDDKITRDALALMDAAERGEWQESFGDYTPEMIAVERRFQEAQREGERA